MSSTSEVGLAKLLAHFGEMINTCTAYGAAYNPGQQAIKLANLSAVKSAADTAASAAVSAFTQYKIATNQRELVFSPLMKLSTRLINALIASGASTQTVSDARSLQRRFFGKRAKALPKKAATGSSDAAQRVALPGGTVDGPVQDAPNIISVSQVSYDGIVDNFGKLRDLLGSLPGYAPNEPDLQVSSLGTLLSSMIASNNVVMVAANALSNSRIARNEVLYNPVSGLVVLAGEVKAYVKSVFGAGSPQYKQLSKLKFA